MSDRQRHRAFAISVLVAACLCALVWLLERPRHGEGSEAGQPARSTKPLVLGNGASAPGPGAASPPPGQSPPGPRMARSSVPEGARIEAVAKRFAAAFVHYQVGQLTVGVRRQIEATTTLPYATSLLSAPPDIPAGERPPPPARLRSVALANGPVGGQAMVAVELDAAAGQIETLTVLMQRSGPGWRVSSLG
jgi:hypothetical protein